MVTMVKMTMTMMTMIIIMIWQWWRQSFFPIICMLKYYITVNYSGLCIMGTPLFEKKINKRRYSVLVRTVKRSSVSSVILASWLVQRHVPAVSLRVLRQREVCSSEQATGSPTETEEGEEGSGCKGWYKATRGDGEPHADGWTTQKGSLEAKREIEKETDS